jgi:CHAT domain-containing protein/tetratricopeptide (TPR) repeat protein
MLLRKHGRSSLTLLIFAFLLLEPMLARRTPSLLRPRVAFAEHALIGQDDDTTPLLTSNEHLTRELSAGESHAYRVALDAGQYFHALVEARGTDAVVTLAAPGGQTLVRLDCRKREPTPVSLVVEVSGTYRLEVRSLEERDARGRYELRVEEVRPAVASDKYRIAAESFFAEGEQLLNDGEAESSRSAVNKYKEASSSWRAAGDRREEAHALKRAGDVHLSLSEYQPALSYYKQALAVAVETGGRRGEGEAADGIAYVYLTLGLNQKALALCARALKLSRAANDRRTEAQAINNLGEIQYGLGKLPRSIDFFQQALPLWRELGDRQGQALAFLNMGYTYSDLGQTRQAFDSYNQALALWQSARERRGEAVTLTALGRLYSRVGESQEALDFFERAMPLIHRVGDPVEEARVFTGMAFVYGRVGEKQAALDYYERALSLFRAANYLNGEASTLGSAGRVYYSLGDNQKAFEYHRRALLIFREVSDQRSEVSELKEIGRLYDSGGDKTGALKTYLLALSFERAQKDLSEQIDTLNLMGRVYEGQARMRRALECYERALSLSREAEYRFGEAATLYNLSRAERAGGDLTAARSRAESALEVAESLRAKVASQDLRASYFASVRQLYELYINLLMELHGRNPDAGYDAAAFEACERGRARSLLETLAAARVGLREKAAPELLEREAALREQLSRELKRRAQPAEAGQLGAEDAAALTREIDELTARYHEAGAQVRVSVTEYTAQSQPRPLGLREIRERDLDDDNTLLLEFSLGEERSYLWVVSRNSLRSYELPPRGEIEAAAGRVRSLLVAPALVQGESFDSRRERMKGTEDAYRREASALSEMLLAQTAAGLGTKRLLIVADGALQYIPFSALPVPGRVGDPTPLLVEHEVTHQPSASALATLRGVEEKRRPAARAVAVFADPVFDADDSRLLSGRDSSYETAQARTREAELSRALGDVGPTWDRGNIPRLLASRAEAEGILGVMSDGDNLNAIGFDADKDAATGPELSQYRIIHFATHGVLDSEHPELSGLLLSRFDSSGRPKEGFLRLDDIYNLNLPADLVVLSACNTGLGKDVKGEGLVGLVRGFMYAGSTRVVASLWKVDDDATAELMTRFYREMLEEKKSPAAALREAQVAMWRQRHWHAPYYWAAFVLQGEYGGKIEGGRRPRRVAPLLLGAAALIASLSCLYACRRMARRKIL